ncbi:PI-PLC X domain-containing protein 1 [Anopheles stephensi]|uniref:Phosphatidylinositol-specific phospholipase C X domain-containing protein n=1 Tax=Anopheles stephensi TaxID=30069 RepID=A0A182Y361_ANOST|nr:PI-PLC X domain-containing protein 1 [Anopheles stephensi]
MSCTVRINNNRSHVVRVTAALLLGLLVLLQAATARGLAQQASGDRVYRPEMDDLYITVNARTRTLELAWRNFDDLSNYILLAEQYPVEAFEPRYYYYTGDTSAGSTSTPSTDVTVGDSGSVSMMMLGDDAASIALSSPEVTTDAGSTTENSVSTTNAYEYTEMELGWVYDFRDESGYRKKEVLFSLQPIYTNGWTKTGIKFNYDLMNGVNTNTSCYGYYAYFVRPNGTVLSAHCMKLHPRWMQELQPHLSAFRMRELFIPGTHDSASYKAGFDPQHQETIITKYALTQDDDVYAQLLQGIRYIDLRVGYYKNSPSPFWANHGISRLHPLSDILEQIKRYARETREIIVVDVQEFPVGFGKEYNIHTKLINFLQSSLGEVMANPSIGWDGTLGDIWAGGKTVVLAYDHEFAFRSFSHVVWRSVQQRWGNVQKVNDLKDYLFKVHHPRGFREYSYRPVADMAELTPDPWGVITDRYGGLRKMADSVNRFVTKWYFEDLGPTANVVAVDFVRGTSIVEAAIYWNLKRVPNGSIKLPY